MTGTEPDLLSQVLTGTGGAGGGALLTWLLVRYVGRNGERKEEHIYHWMKDLHEWHRPINRDGQLYFPWHNRDSVAEMVAHMDRLLEKMDAIMENQSEILKQICAAQERILVLVKDRVRGEAVSDAR